MTIASLPEHEHSGQLVNVLILGSESYHDCFRWPLKDRRVFERWKRETAWGRHFEEYGRAGTMARPEAVATPK